MSNDADSTVFTPVKRKHRRKFRLASWINGLILAVISFVTLFPFIYIVSVSLSDPAAVVLQEVFLWPVRPTFNTFQLAFSDKRIWTGFKNSLLYVALGTMISVMVTMMTAYPLSHPKFRYRGFFTRMIVFTMLFQGGLIPLYLVVRGLHLLNTLWSVVLPGAVYVFHLILARSFIQQLPYEMNEAAFVDGANELVIFTRIVMPLSKPIIATLTLYYAVGIWNSYFYPMIFLMDTDKFPLQVYLRELVIGAELQELRASQQQVQRSGLEGLQGAMKSPQALKSTILVISTLPILIMYPFLQKYFVTGITLGSVKG